MALLEGFSIDRAFFTNNQRDTICVKLMADTADETGMFQVIDYHLDVDDNDTDYQELMKSYTIDQIHEDTFKNIRNDQNAIKRIAIEVAKKNGWILSDVALEDDMAYQKQDEAPDENVRVVVETQEIKVAATLPEVLNEFVFTDSPSTEYLFELKLKLFEMDFIKNNKNRELKKNLRISKTVPEALRAAIELWTTK
jgi:hypothetical protein|tara:strand:- start:1122 stop:1709 length:588 start_codon:yes stop_codon:yes gene_type:complete